jgi:hypothetical protein
MEKLEMKHNRALTFVICCMTLTFGMMLSFALVGIQAVPAYADSTALIRIVHASPDAGTVDVFVDGKKTLSNFQFGTVTPYTPIPAGNHSIQIALIGQGPNAAIVTQTISVSAGVAYTVAALGTKATGYSLHVFTDNNVVPWNQARLRFYHLSPGMGNASVTSNGNTLISGLSYTQASSYLTEPGGSYTFNISTASTNGGYAVSTTLKTAMITSIFVVGMVNSNPGLKFVITQVAGVPGMPQTGSDPSAQPVSPHPFNPYPWLLGALALIALAVSVTTLYGKMGRGKRV